MNLLDILIILLGVILLIRSYFRGFVQEVASLGGLIVAVLIGLRYYPAAQNFLENALGPSPYLSVAGFAVLFFATLAVVSLATSQASKVISRGSLGSLNRFLGLCFGALKAMLIIIISVFLLTYALGPSRPFISESRLTPDTLQAAGWLLDKMPRKLSRVLDETRSRVVKRALPPEQDKMKDSPRK